MSPVLIARIPIRVRREAVARQALRHRPLVQTRRTHASSIERVPHMLALTHPPVVLARRPPTQGTTNPGPRRLASFLPFNLFLHFIVDDRSRFRSIIQHGVPIPEMMNPNATPESRTNHRGPRFAALFSFNLGLKPGVSHTLRAEGQKLRSEKSEIPRPPIPTCSSKPPLP